MLRRTFLASLVVFVSISLAAQTPQGWKVRVDKSTNAQDPDDNPNLKFITMGTGFHVTGGPAGTFWNPANTVTGNYTAKASFTLTKPSPHVNYYGLVFGGADLDAASQNYIYFLVAQDGNFLVRHRAGDAVHDIIRMKHVAVKVPDSAGKSTNNLEVRVAGDTISYVVNGSVVHTTPKAGMTAKTDGIVGVRVNHLLDVHIDGFGVQKG